MSYSKPAVITLLPHSNHTWVGLQQVLSLFVDLLCPVFGAVSAAHEVFKMSIQLSPFRLAQFLLSELKRDTNKHPVRKPKIKKQIYARGFNKYPPYYAMYGWC